MDGEGGYAIWGIGNLGVSIFFAISGFVIPSSLRGGALAGSEIFCDPPFLEAVSILLGCAATYLVDWPIFY
ncbi:hypothetical protein [Cephaloticoccus primus]|uniref:hypothetical protein n=1 Tax=Cephaloticoccus primus TaxID=1548207 RepID=UPI0034E05C05